MHFGCCIYVFLLLNVPEMAHDWINKIILFYSMRIKNLTSHDKHWFEFRYNTGSLVVYPSSAQT